MREPAFDVAHHQLQVLSIGGTESPVRLKVRGTWMGDQKAVLNSSKELSLLKVRYVCVVFVCVCMDHL